MGFVDGFPDDDEPCFHELDEAAQAKILAEMIEDDSHEVGMPSVASLPLKLKY